jgi:glycopeptide antibiotics resistance protein
MLFFPLGILLPLVWRRLRFWRGIQIAVAVSISIEIVQYLTRAWSNRAVDVNDVILNVVGASLGLVLVSLLLRLLQGTRPVALAIVMFGCSLL